LSGTVLRRAEAHGVEVPMTALVHGLVSRMGGVEIA